MSRDKKRPPADPGWLPVGNAKPDDSNGWIRVEGEKPKEQWIPTTPQAPARSNPVPPSPVKPRPTSAREREMWADPVLSPWAPAEPKAQAEVPIPTPSNSLDSVGTTSCPKCSTQITYQRRGSPPWEVVCANCGARGRLSK